MREPRHAQRTLHKYLRCEYPSNKNGANKMLNFIKENGIKHGIDYLNKIMDVQSFEVQPQLVFSEWNEDGRNIDSDIQNNYESLNFSNINENSIHNSDAFIFVPHIDQIENDIYYHMKSVAECMEIALNDAYDYFQRVSLLRIHHPDNQIHSSVTGFK